jgi:hypothetical protein
VWLVIEPFSIRSYELPTLQDRKPRETGLDLFLGLLGLDFGHEAIYNRVLGEDKRALDERMYVEQNWGIMNVVPAWKILELLDTAEVAEMRQERETKIYEERASQ